jgi:hypothetical protein
MRRLVWLMGALLAGLSAMAAQDGKKITSHDGGCQVTVPVAWDGGKSGGLASSPDKKVSLMVGSPAKVSSFDGLKQNAQKLYTKDKVTKNSATEFEMEGQSMSGKPNVYRSLALPSGKFCTAEVIFESGTLTEARKIVETLRPPK